MDWAISAPALINTQRPAQGYGIIPVLEAFLCSSWRGENEIQAWERNEESLTGTRQVCMYLLLSRAPQEHKLHSMAETRYAICEICAREIMS